MSGLAGRPFLGRPAEDLRLIASHTGCGDFAALLHPSIPAIWAHRIAHHLHPRFRLLARIISAAGRLASGGIEIHPGAVLGRRVFFAHGTGTVVGETARVGDDVVIGPQVTLGAVGWWRDNNRPPGAARHPTVGNRVWIGPNATVLGPVVLGDDAVIGPQSLVTTDIPAGAEVTAPAAVDCLPG
ncbi:serine O-acetyltransferase [Actinokineospora enzanensis]|uniref:serine O-acetyltransferase n=1 Tax=Actinokineospora enzanensis TaxID=155975 RepID=UPI00035C57A3|nr:serine O-acetyltransferase [Actinokineospora enzanensis]